MADHCPKCGCSIPSIRLADHVKRCSATRSLPSLPGRGTPVRPRRAVRSTAAELEYRRLTEYYQQLSSKENEGLGAILNQRVRKPKSRIAGRSSSTASVAATSDQRSENEARAKEIAAMKARIAELEANLRNPSRS